METNEKIKKIKKLLRTKENVIASESMQRLGMKYKKNHGLSIKQIKDIALEFKNDHELALELYKQDIRELKLMAFIIENSKTVSLEQVEEWLYQLNDSEQAEQIAINLLVNNSKFYDKVFDWAENENKYVKRAAFVLIARIAMMYKKKYNINTYKTYIELCLDHFNDENIIVARAISWALRRIGRVNKELYKEVLNAVNEIKLMNTNYAQLIAEEVLYELNDGMIKSMIY